MDPAQGNYSVADSRLLMNGLKKIERRKVRLEAFGGPFTEECKCTPLFFVALKGDKAYTETLWWWHIISHF